MDCRELEALLTDFLEGLLAPAVEAAADVGRLPLEAGDRDRLLGEILAVLDPADDGSGERERRAHRRVRGDDHE